ncbi:hypothetical protein B0H19DRAFT_1257378 [Mycena capillaripes]|nr:hypothetical protein B0H19DRAFT_1257378 [Mycena capillaripes]
MASMQRPSLAHDNNTCPYCWTHLPIRLCKNGENRNKRYLLNNDLHPGIKPYWHFWSVSESNMLGRSQESSLLPSPPQDRYVHTPSAPPPLLLPSYVQSLPPQTVPTKTHREARCWQPGCSSSRVAVQCKSARCKEHCIILNQGDCPVKKHHPSMMSQRQRRKANVSAPLFRPRNSSPPSDFAAGILDNVTFPAAFSSNSPSTIPSPSPRNSPELDEREAHELDLAMALSLASTPPLSIASTSNPYTSTAVPTPSTLPTVSPSTALPQKRVLATSIVQRVTLPNPALLHN